MRVDVSFKNMESSDYLDNVISKYLDRVKRRIKIFKSDDPVHLTLHIEKNYHREEYFAWVNLYLPKKVLRAQQKAPEASLSVNKVSQALIRQIDKYKVMIERHLQRKKPKYFQDNELDLSEG
ncbi:MAG: HPF/RaiA family ribosome-associated protein [Candidatus Omnitrophica bacterium]|nr:HPF/RaiA family ribosome-associated protein [Candidatus Omnitrophota bacterium]